MRQRHGNLGAPRTGAAMFGGLIGGLAAIALTVATAHGATTPTRPPSRSMAGMSMPRQGVAAPSGGTVARLHQRVVRVTIHNFAFQPARLVVSRGTRIIWTNLDSDPHTVDSVKGIWSSDALDTDTQFARVFAKAGAFAYYCSIHPFMHGTIIVKK